MLLCYGLLSSFQKNMLDLKNELVCNIKMFTCVRGIDFVYISTIFLLDLGIVPTVWYLFLFPFCSQVMTCLWLYN